MKPYFFKLSALIPIAVMMFVAVSVTTSAQALAFDGEGTAESPYLINTCDDLYDIADDVNTLAAHYRLNDNIDCAATATLNPNPSEWVNGNIPPGEVDPPALIPDPYSGVINNGYSGFDPIGDPMTPFTGVFDGNNKTISNLWIFRKDTSHVGLFAYTQNASITNLTLNQSSIVGGGNTGGLVGVAENTAIMGVTVQSSMTRAYLNFRGGGIVGEMYHNLENDSPAYIIDSAVVSGNVHGSGNIIGGIVGYMNGGIISGGSSSADIDGGYAIGGIVGEMSSGTISNTTVGEVLVHADYSEGAVAKFGDKTGGFVGSMTGGAIYSSSTAASVEAEGSEVGGFVGSVRDYDIENQTFINGAHATGTVTGLGNANDNATLGSQNSNSVGGFAGSASGEGVSISNAYASGNVVVVDTPLLADSFGIGGFIGSGGCNANINQSYATGSVTAANALSVGGFTGSDSCEGPGGTYERVYATGSVEGLQDVGGLFGNAQNTTITKAYATGSVIGNVNVGGLAGNYSSGGEASVSQSYATGLVSASDQTAGGLFGFFRGTAEDVYVRSSVSGPLNVGGFAGEVDGNWIIRRAYATGELTANPGTPKGFIGEDNTSSDVIAEGLYYDQQATAVSVDEYATAKDTNQLKLVANQATFEGYDFEDIWEFNLGQNDDYPLFQWQLDPIGQILCEPAYMTATTGRIACQVDYSGGDESRADPEVWMNPQYRVAGDTEWISMDWTAKSEGRHTFYGLDPNTTYELSMTVANNIINQALISVGTTLPVESDIDADGIVDITENNGPNNGDANNDGTLDAEQDSVTSQNNFITDKQFVLQSTCASNFNTQIGRESDEDKDVAYDYPAGLAAFVLQNCGADGSTATVTLYYFGDYDASKFILRKSNSDTGQYTTISGAALSNVTIGGQPALKVVYEITDGGPLDQDGVADGNIVDPAGIAVSVVGAPNTGLGRRK